MARIGRSYPRFEVRILEQEKRSAAAAYRRFLQPIAPLADPVFDAVEGHKVAARLLAGLTLVGLVGWALGILPLVP